MKSGFSCENVGVGMSMFADVFRGFDARISKNGKYIDHEKSSISDFVQDLSEIVPPSFAWRECGNAKCTEHALEEIFPCCDSCSTVYCSDSCMATDRGHICPLNNSRAEVVECSCNMIIIVIKSGEYGYMKKIEGIFKGVKKGSKFIRGTFCWSAKDAMVTESYAGGMTTAKLNGEFVCIPHGKGTLTSEKHVIIGNFIDGFLTGVVDFFHGSGIGFRGGTEGGTLIDMYEACHGDTVMYADNSVWPFNSNESARGMFEEWKRTGSAIVLDMKNNMEPRIVAKSNLKGMVVKRVVYEEKVQSIGFRCCVIEGGGEEFVAMCATRGCLAHGVYKYAPTCMKVVNVDRDVSEDTPCTCEAPDSVSESNIEDTQLPIPTGIPKMRRVIAKKSRSDPKSDYGCSRERGVRGVSRRDMSADKERFSSLGDALERGNWVLERQNNHLVYTRMHGQGRQVFVASKTPSCCRSEKNALSSLSSIMCKQ